MAAPGIGKSAVYDYLNRANVKAATKARHQL